MRPTEEFDYVIVGAGSAGCVLADRLTEDGRHTVLVLEYGGRPVTGRRISVPVATAFVLRLTARDLYGNETPIGALGQMLRSSRAQVAAQGDLEVVNLDENDAAVLITLKARRLGMHDFTVGNGITASVGLVAIAK